MQLPDDPDMNIPWDSDTRLTRLMPDYTGTQVERTIAGRKLTMTTGHLGPFADGLATARYGDSVVMASVVARHEVLPSSFLPLSVEYREKSFAAGFIPTTWTRREGMISDREILGARIIDRTARPLFLKGFPHETQIVATLLAADEDCAPEVVSVAAAAAALSVSDVPWRGPAGAIRVGWVDGDAVVNPTAEQDAASSLQLLYSGTRDRCLMLEVGAKEMPEEHLIAALREAQQALLPILDMQDELAAAVGRGKRRGEGPQGVPEDILAAAEEDIGDAARHLFVVPQSKSARGVRQGILQSQCVERLRVAFPDAPQWQLEAAAGKVTGSAVRDNILRMASADIPEQFRVLEIRRRANAEAGTAGSAAAKPAAVASGAKSGGLAARLTPAEQDGHDSGAAGVASGRVRLPAGADGAQLLGFASSPGPNGSLRVAAYDTAAAAKFVPCFLPGAGRVDGRSSEEVRPLQCEVGVLPVVHGSAVFARGGTQVLCTTTLGPPEIAQMLRPVGGGPSMKSFMLHYDFPPYSTNNTGRVGGMNRRMIGHGNLAEKAVAAVMPGDDDFRFTVRVTSEVTGSDGSSSMATATGATLALLDAGVPLVRPVAGVSVGMVTEPSVARGEGGRFVLLTDIVGMEDHAGDMDFKVAGSRAGVTAAQLDIKLDGGVPLPLLEAGLWKAAEARGRILDRVEAAAPKGRVGLKESAPRIELLPISFTKRGLLIGPGGATIRRIQRESGASVRLLPDADFAQVFARGEESLIVARQLIGEVLAGQDDRAAMEAGGGRYGADADHVIEVGEEVEVEVIEVMDFGAVCHVVGRHGGSGDGGRVEGLLHVSEMQMSSGRPRNASDVVSRGSRAMVRVIDVDARQRGKFSMVGVEQVFPSQQDEDPASGSGTDGAPDEPPRSSSEDAEAASHAAEPPLPDRRDAAPAGSPAGVEASAPAAEERPAPAGQMAVAARVSPHDMELAARVDACAASVATALGRAPAEAANGVDSVWGAPAEALEYRSERR